MRFKTRGLVSALLLLVLLYACAFLFLDRQQAAAFERVRTSSVDGFSSRGMYVKLGINNYLLCRYSTIADDGFSVERMTDHGVIWRIQTHGLGVEHSKYSHEAMIDRVDLAKARFRVTSQGAGSFTEWRSLQTGRLQSRSRQQEAHYDPSRARFVFVREIPPGLEVGEFIDIAEYDRVHYRFDPISDSGVEIERIQGSRRVWREDAIPLGVAHHSEYQHRAMVQRLGDQMWVKSFGSDGDYFEQRDIETGEVLKRDEKAVPRPDR